MIIKKLPTHRCRAMENRVIHVPLDKKDVYNTVKSLPRLPEDAAVVPVTFKKSLNLQSEVLKSYVRPNVCNKAIDILKESGHKYYKDIEKVDLPEDTDENTSSSSPSFHHLCRTRQAKHPSAEAQLHRGLSDLWPGSERKYCVLWLVLTRQCEPAQPPHPKLNPHLERL